VPRQAPVGLKGRCMKPTTLKFASAGLLAAFAGAMWFAFVRRVPELSAVGTILSKGEMAGGTYVQQRSTQRGMPTTPNLITLCARLDETVTPQVISVEGETG
jgi:hypothetical protein